MQQLINGIDGNLNKYVFSEGGFYYNNELYQEANECLNPGRRNKWES